MTFEGIPPKSDNKNIKIGFNLRQDLPVLIRPAKLAVVTDAWKYRMERNGYNAYGEKPQQIRCAFGTKRYDSAIWHRRHAA